MTTLLIVFAVIVGLLLALTAIPIDIDYRIRRIDRVDGRMDFRWLFGLARFGFDIPGKDEELQIEPELPTSGKKSKRRKKSGRKTEPANILGVLRQSAFRKRVLRFIRDLLRATHGRDLFLRLRIGLGDPADTGRLWGWIGPVAAVAASQRFAGIIIEPEFMDPVFEFESRGHFRLIPLQFIALVIGFLLSPPSIRAWRTLRRGAV